MYHTSAVAVGGSAAESRGQRRRSLPAAAAGLNQS